ncbi:MAG: TonB-dependent receptor [Alistipes sp.]|nr:TonB-dependent receptor [Alistipes sp.]
MMRRVVSILAMLALVLPIHAEERDWLRDGLDIPEVQVLAHRPMRDIGVEQTKIDSAMLHQNISLSMADILSFNSSIFVKNSGRATLSTVSFRGTSSAHTQVLWNGLRINSPMLGMTDFSMIPSFLVDNATLLHGSSSVSESGGGLGGAVRLSTEPTAQEGFGLHFVQGVGSFCTFDDFLRLTYGKGRWHSSTRVVFSASRNDYRYRNYDKKENIYDDNHNIISQYHPIERNRNAAFRDTHLLQELYYKTKGGDRLSLNAWYTNSRRELPLLTTDYGSSSNYENYQRENSFRGVVGYDHIRTNWRIGAKAGYIFSWLAYDYSYNHTSATASRSRINTIYGSVAGNYSFEEQRLLLSGDITLHENFVRSEDGAVGYNAHRAELSAVVSARWRPIERIGIAATLREEMFGKEWSLPIPMVALEATLSKRGNLMLRGSASRNHRAPSLNDLYFRPGGNPNLRSEQGWSYDAGLSSELGRNDIYRIKMSASWFESWIDDWILWLPTNKGFFSPRNVKSVHSYGIEAQASLWVRLSKDWRLDLNGSVAWTPSVNVGEAISFGDNSIGKQLPYIPRFSSSITGRLSFRSWSLLYKWCHYSERFTMSSNDISLTGKLPPYFMNNLELEKQFSFSWADLSLKGIINNLFNEEYISVLSHPMPGINFELFIGIRPKW